MKRLFLFSFFLLGLIFIKPVFASSGVDAALYDTGEVYSSVSGDLTCPFSQILVLVSTENGSKWSGINFDLALTISFHQNDITKTTQDINFNVLLDESSLGGYFPNYKLYGYQTFDGSPVNSYHYDMALNSGNLSAKFFCGDNLDFTNIQEYTYGGGNPGNPGYLSHTTNDSNNYLLSFKLRGGTLNWWPQGYTSNLSSAELTTHFRTTYSHVYAWQSPNWANNVSKTIYFDYGGNSTGGDVFQELWFGTVARTSANLTEGSYSAVFVQPPPRYPLTDYIKIKPDSGWQFIVGYLLPPDEWSVDKIVVYRFTDNTFNQSTKTLIYNDLASVIDPNHDNTFPIVLSVSDSETGCFVVQIQESNGFFHNPPSGVLCWQGDNIDGIGFTHYTFDGGLYFDQSILGRVFYTLKGKIPLYYYYQAKSIIDSSSQILGGSPDDVTMSLPFEGKTLSMPLLNFSDSHLTTFFVWVRAFMVWVLWIGLFVELVYVADRFTHND